MGSENWTGLGRSSTSVDADNLEQDQDRAGLTNRDMVKINIWRELG